MNMEEYKSYVEVCNKKFDLLSGLIPYQHNIQHRINTTNVFSNVFIMMKYRDYNEELSNFIIDTLKENGLNGIRADMEDWNLTEDSVFNPLAVLYCCNYGIALFDKPLDGQYYGANVAYELGIMHLQNKKCLILIHDDIKDKKPFDILGRMHKTYNNDLGVKKLINKWIRENKIYPHLKSTINPYIIAVGIIKYNNMFLLTKRQKKEQTLEWGFPAAQIKPNSMQEDILVSEIKKETNIDVKILFKIGERKFPNIPVYVHYYFCEYIKGEIVNLDPSENEIVKWASANEALRKITSDIYPPIKEILSNSIINE